jgi:hypothetical protein
MYSLPTISLLCLFIYRFVEKFDLFLRKIWVDLLKWAMPCGILPKRKAFRNTVPHSTMPHTYWSCITSMPGIKMR